MAFTNYKDLTVWEKSMDLTCEIYKLINKLPREENFALCEEVLDIADKVGRMLSNLIRTLSR